jgi:hypothetical protein
MGPGRPQGPGLVALEYVLSAPDQAQDGGETRLRHDGARGAECRSSLVKREIARLFRLAVAAGTRVLCAAGGLTTLRTLVAAVRNEPGFVLATLEPPNDRELRRVLVRIAQRDGLQPERRVVTAAAISAEGDTRRALGALTSCLFGPLTVVGGLVVRNPRVG